MVRNLQIGDYIPIINLHVGEQTVIGHSLMLFKQSIYGYCEIDVNIRDELVCYGSNIPKYLTHHARWEAYMMCKFDKGAKVWYMEI